jgi:hypothetical protein
MGEPFEVVAEIDDTVGPVGMLICRCKSACAAPAIGLPAPSVMAAPVELMPVMVGRAVPSGPPALLNCAKHYP